MTPTTKPTTKPKTTDTFPRVFRGGGWSLTGPAGVRAALRSAVAPTYRSDDLGFRTRLSGRSPRV